MKEVNLHSCKVLLPRLTSQEKDNVLIITKYHIGLIPNFPPLKVMMDDLAYYDYDVFIMFEEIRESLIRVLHDAIKDCLVELDDIS